MLNTYRPEMNETAPAAEFEAFYWGHRNKWNIKTPKTLSGVGVKLVGVLKSSDLNARAQHKIGWNEYILTALAFKKLSAEHSVSVPILL